MPQQAVYFAARGSGVGSIYMPSTLLLLAAVSLAHWECNVLKRPQVPAIDDVVTMASDQRGHMCSPVVRRLRRI